MKKYVHMYIKFCLKKRQQIFRNRIVICMTHWISIPSAQGVKIPFIIRPVILAQYLFSTIPGYISTRLINRAYTTVFIRQSLSVSSHYSHNIFYIPGFGSVLKDGIEWKGDGLYCLQNELIAKPLDVQTEKQTRRIYADERQFFYETTTKNI